MKKTHFGKSKTAHFFSGKGFYIALALSLVAVGAATLFAMNRTMNSLADGGETAKKNTSSVNEWGFTQDVGTTQSNIAISSSDLQSSGGSGSSSGNYTASQFSETESSNLPPSFVMPLNGSVLNPFSNGELVKSKTLNEWRTHDGIDIKANAGTAVKSCAAGTVTAVTEDPLWGVTVTIRHSGGYESFYYGLNQAVKVSKNQKVALGDTIGTVGGTAIIETAEESHLHFAMKKDGKWIDPAKTIQTIK